MNNILKVDKMNEHCPVGVNYTGTSLSLNLNKNVIKLLYIHFDFEAFLGRKVRILSVYVQSIHRFLIFESAIVGLH